MRETCARALAAALMTGSIATLVWMSALAGTSDETMRPLATSALPPPPSVTIRVKAAKPRPKPVRRVAVAPPAAAIHSAPRTAVRQLVTVRPHRAKKRPARQLAATRPGAAAPTPTVVPAATPEVAELPDEQHVNGNAHGHDKARGKGHEKHED